MKFLHMLYKAFATPIFIVVHVVLGVLCLCIGVLAVVMNIAERVEWVICNEIKSTSPFNPFNTPLMQRFEEVIEAIGGVW